MKEDSARRNVAHAKPDALRRTLLKAPLGLSVMGLGGLGLGSSKAVAQVLPVPSIAVDLPAAVEAVRAFRVAIAPDAIADLRRRLAMTRWPERETVNDRSQGVQLERAQGL